MKIHTIISAFAISSAIVLGIAGNANAGYWTPEDSLSHHRYFLAATAGNDGTIFAIGGETGTGVLKSVEVFSPSTKLWAPGPALPVGRTRHAAATGGDGRIYVIGGSDNIQGETETVFALRPGSGAGWTTVAPLPTTRNFLDAATGADGRIYVIGGNNGTDCDVLEIYDPATNQWTTGAPMPTRRSHMGVATGGDGRIYAIGGSNWNGGLRQKLNVVEAYSPITNSWTTVAPLPTRRDGVLATESNSGLIYAIGGRDFQSFTKRVDVYSPQQNKWWRVPNTQADHILGAAATATRRVFAIGGESTTAVESRPSFCAICK